MTHAGAMTPLFASDRGDIVRPGGLAPSAIYDDPRDDEASWFEDGPAPGPFRRFINVVVGTTAGFVWAGSLALIAVLIERFSGSSSRRH